MKNLLILLVISLPLIGCTASIGTPPPNTTTTYTTPVESTTTYTTVPDTTTKQRSPKHTNTSLNPSINV